MNVIYVEDVKDRSNTPKDCNAIYVEDVEDRSNTPKGCNAMYVEDVEDGKRTYRHIFYHTFLDMVSFECNAIYVKDDKDRSNTPKGCNAMCVEDVEDGKRTYTHTFWLITSLIFNGFSIRKSFGKLRLRASQPYHQILCILKHVRDVGDKSSTPKGCNAIYVGDVRDCNNVQYT